MAHALQLADPGTANRRHFIQSVLPFLPLPGASGIVDLGCGDGYYCSLFSDVSRALTPGKLPIYRGFDLDDEALDKARLEHPHATFRNADITNGIAPEALQAGLSLCCETFSILPDLESVIDKMLSHGRGTVAFDFLWTLDGREDELVLPLKVLPPFSYHLRSQRFAFDMLNRLLTRHPEYHVKNTSSWAFSSAALEEFTGASGIQAANVWFVLSRDRD